MYRVGNRRKGCATNINPHESHYQKGSCNGQEGKHDQPNRTYPKDLETKLWKETTPQSMGQPDFESESQLVRQMSLGICLL
jgi:hypothetical protein